MRGPGVPLFAGAARGAVGPLGLRLGGGEPARGTQYGVVRAGVVLGVVAVGDLGPGLGDGGRVRLVDAGGLRYAGVRTERLPRREGGLGGEGRCGRGRGAARGLAVVLQPAGGGDRHPGHRHEHGRARPAHHTRRTDQIRPPDRLVTGSVPSAGQVRCARHPRSPARVTLLAPAARLAHRVHPRSPPHLSVLPRRAGRPRRTRAPPTRPAG